MQQNRRNDRERRGRKKVCYFTANKIEHIDFKDVDLLKRFITERGKILPRRITGRHLMSTKNAKRRLRLRQDGEVSPAEKKRIKVALPYGL